MAEYIDKNELLHKIRWASDAEEAVMSVRRMPTANVVPVRYGKWERFLDKNGDKHYRCSVCSMPAIINMNNENVMTPYCPECGAKME